MTPRTGVMILALLAWACAESSRAPAKPAEAPAPPSTEGAAREVEGAVGSSTVGASEAPRLGPVIAEGLASRYADSLAGRKTASGAPYDPEARTCAHRRLRLGTVLHVRRKKTGQTVTCRVNDRGPFHDDRILDLSRAAAEALGFTGVAQVEVRKVLAPE